jgi:2-oxoglutarate dehydrogenase E1 component
VADLRRKTGIDAAPIVQRVREQLDAAQKEALELEKAPPMRRLPLYWKGYVGGRHDASLEVDTGVAQQDLTEVGTALTSYPAGFHIHPKVEKLLQQRREMSAGQAALDYGMAEALAFGSLLKQGVPVRLTGQDSRRGTFNQRHAALTDIETEEEYVPLEHLAKAPSVVRDL